LADSSNFAIACSTKGNGSPKHVREHLPRPLSLFLAWERRLGRRSTRIISDGLLAEARFGMPSFRLVMVVVSSPRPNIEAAARGSFGFSARLEERCVVLSPETIEKGFAFSCHLVHEAF
jgi:hypothetical protein